MFESLLRTMLFALPAYFFVKWICDGTHCFMIVVRLRLFTFLVYCVLRVHFFPSAQAHPKVNDPLSCVYIYIYIQNFPSVLRRLEVRSELFRAFELPRSRILEKSRESSRKLENTRENSRKLKKYRENPRNLALAKLDKSRESLRKLEKIRENSRILGNARENSRKLEKARENSRKLENTRECSRKLEKTRLPRHH